MQENSPASSEVLAPQLTTAALCKSITVVDKMQMQCKPNESLDFAQMKAEASVHDNSSPVSPQRQQLNRMAAKTSKGMV